MWREDARYAWTRALNLAILASVRITLVIPLHIVWVLFALLVDDMSNQSLGKFVVIRLGTPNTPDNDTSVL